MKKWIVISLSFLLLLTGCVQNAPFIADAMKKSMNLTSYEAKSTFTFDTNLPVEDPEVRALLQALKDGVHVQIKQTDAHNAHYTLSFQDSKPLLGTSLWPEQVKAAVDFYLGANNTLFKTSADRKYLSLPTDEAMIPSSGLNDLPKQLIEDYLSESKFKLKNANLMGTKTVTLPNGEKEKTAHVRLFFELDEALNWLAYTLEYMSKHPKIEKQLAGLNSTMPSSEIDNDNIKQSLKEMANELKAINVNQLKKDGYDFNLVLEFWINSDRNIVQSNSTVLMKMPATFFYDMGLISKAGYKSIYFKINSKDQYWNHNKKVAYTLPKKNQIITIDQLVENPKLLESFSTGSPIRMIGQSMLPMEEYGQ